MASTLVEYKSQGRTIQKSTKAKGLSMLKVLLIEDNSDDALLVQLALEESGDFQLKTVDRLSKAMDCSKAGTFDVALLDLNLPDAMGLEALIKLRRHDAQLPIVVFTGIDEEQLGIMALQRGAQDYLIKGTDNNRISRSLQYAVARMKAHNGESITANPASDSADSIKSPGYAVLTEREMQVLKLMGKGCTNQEITEQLTISLATVKTHIHNIMSKLSTADRTNTVLEAQRRRLM